MALRRLDPVTAGPPTSATLDALDALDGCRRRFQLRFLEGDREPGLGASVSVGSPRHRDARLAVLRRLVAVLPLDAWTGGVPDEALAAAAGRAGLTLAETEALQLSRPLRRLARALRGFTAGFAWSRAVPFRVSLGAASVHGALDLLLVGPPGMAAVCLVAGRGTGDGAALTVLLEALQARAARGGQVRAAVFAVDGEDERLRWASEPPIAPSSIDARLASALALGPVLSEGVERSRCEGLGCGFVRRCHPPERGL